jgi:NADH-quinone oxidoreductase subunit D
LRINQPYECYSSLDFKIPVGFNKDCYDRFVMRIEEMNQSIVILKQCINQIPSGAVLPVVDEEDSSAKEFVKMYMEPIITHFKILGKNFNVPSGYAYVGVEAPKGEFGVFLVSNNKTRPYRCRLRSPGFFHLQGLDYMSRNHLLADVVTIIGTQDIVFGEVDR